VTTTPRGGPEPPDGLFGELLPWVSMAEALGWAGADRPARTVCGDRNPRWAYGAGESSYATGWTLETEQRSETAVGRVPVERNATEPAPTLVANADRWELRSSSREKVNDRTRPRSLDAPAMTVAFGHSDMLWSYRNGNQDHTAERLLDEPAPTVHFGARGNAVGWVAERPATTVMGSSRVWPPGHKASSPAELAAGYPDRAGTTAVRVTVEQASVLQSFPADYPWRGCKTSRFRQVGDAVPVLLAAAVLGQVLDVDWRALLWGLGGAA